MSMTRPAMMLPFRTPQQGLPHEPDYRAMDEVERVADITEKSPDVFDPSKVRAESRQTHPTTNARTPSSHPIQERKGTLRNPAKISAILRDEEWY